MCSALSGVLVVVGKELFFASLAVVCSPGLCPRFAHHAEDRSLVARYVRAVLAGRLKLTAYVRLFALRVLYARRFMS